MLLYLVWSWCKFDDKIPHYFEQIRRRGFKQEKHKERKLVYTTSEYFKTLTPEEKKAVALVAKGNKLTIRAVPGARFFVPETIYNERRINFFKNTTLVAKYDVRLVLGLDFNEKSIYEFRLKNETVNMTIWDFSLPFFRIKGRGLYFDEFRYFWGTPSQYKKIIKPPKHRAGYIVQWFNYVEDAFILDEEKAIRKIYFDLTMRLNVLQESYFIYDHSSLLKLSFISKLNTFLPIYCSVSTFSEKIKKRNLKSFRQHIRKYFLSKNWQKKVSYWFK